MPVFSVAWAVPSSIQRGLEVGSFERLGGLVREAVSGRVVAFLREAIDLKTIPGDVLAGGTGLGVLNLSIATMGFAVVLKRMSHIQHRLQQTHDLLEKLDQKIDLSFYANFCAALDLAHDAFTLVRLENRDSAARQAIDRLAATRHHYTPLATSQLNTRGPAVDAYLATLSLAYVAEARCYLELEELDAAAQRLSAGASALRPHVRGQIETLLTSNPAAYLHPALTGRVDLRRLTQVLRWIDPGLDENAVFEAQRGNFAKLVRSPETWSDSLPSAVWDPKFDSVKGAAAPPKAASFEWPASIRVPAIGAIDLPAWRVRLPGLGRTAGPDPYDRLPAVMETIEGLIEDMRRLEGYSTEVDAFRNTGMSFRDWRALSLHSSSPGDQPALHCVEVETAMDVRPATR